MAERALPDVRLELWTQDDLPVLERSNTSEAMVLLGGPIRSTHWVFDLCTLG